MPMEEHHHRM